MVQDDSSFGSSLDQDSAFHSVHHAWMWSALQASAQLVTRFPDHEALWIFRRRIVTTLVSWYFDTHNNNDDKYTSPLPVVTSSPDNDAFIRNSSSTPMSTENGILFRDLLWKEIWKTHVQQVYKEVIELYNSNVLFPPLFSSSAGIAAEDATATESHPSLTPPPRIPPPIHAGSYLLWVLTHIQRHWAEQQEQQRRQEQQQHPSTLVVNNNDGEDTTASLQTMYSQTWQLLHQVTLASLNRKNGSTSAGGIGHRLWLQHEHTVKAFL
jgi:hypothetical protein